MGVDLESNMTALKIQTANFDADIGMKNLRTATELS